MGLTKPFPFPGERVQSEEMSQDDRICAGVRNDDDSLVRIVDGPQGAMFGMHRMDAVTVEGFFKT